MARRNLPQKSSSHASEDLTCAGLVSTAGRPAACGKRSLTTDAAALTSGSWSARAMPSSARASRIRAAAMRTS